MGGMAARMMMKNSGKMGQLTSRVGGLRGRISGLGAGAGEVMGVPGIPAGPGMQGAVGAPVTQRIYWPGTRGEPQREIPARQWTPTSVTTSFAGMAGAAAVAGGGVVAATKAPGLFATWAPTIAFVIGVLIILGFVIYYTFYHKDKVDKAVKMANDAADDVADEAKKGVSAIKGKVRKLK